MEENTEYSGNNAWYLNMNNGNQNNNNKYNTYYARAVAASQQDGGVFVLSDDQRDELDNEFRDAYNKCVSGKGGSPSVCEFLPDHQFKLIELVDSIINRTYRPKPLGVFIVYKPTVREIYESQLADRVVDIFISFYLEPCMNKVIPRNATACRAGLGTKAADEIIADAFERCSRHYTRDCWVIKYDVQSYYMSIDKARLLSMIISMLDKYSDAWCLDIVKWLVTVRLMTDYAGTAIRKSSIDKWRDLPPHKSLFNRPHGIGIPIGLLLTNESANIYLSPIDHYIMEELGYEFYLRSIDDSLIVSDDKDRLLHYMARIREKYAEMGLTIHPNKYYFQHYSKGVKFLNVYQKPGRTYSSNRCLTNCFKKIHAWNLEAHDNVAFQIKNCEKFASTINSYLGMLKHLDEYNMRRRICEMVFSEWSKVMYPDRENFHKMIVRRRYRTRQRISRRLRHKRHEMKSLIIKAMAESLSQPIKSFGRATRAVAKEKVSQNQWIGRANIQDMTETQGEGENQTTKVVEGFKTWNEQVFDHEPTAQELNALAQAFE